MGLSPHNDGSAPAAKRPRHEAAPDISADVSDIPEVKLLIAQNNAQVRPKHRRHQRDFLNHAFDELGAAAKQDPSKAEVVLSFLAEMAEKHQELPRNTVLAKVLYMWCTPQLANWGIRVVQTLLGNQTKLPTAFLAAFDERVAAVALRLAVKATAVDVALLWRILDALPADAFKRRVFHPLFEYCRSAADVPLCFEFFDMARAKALEMWDNDYNEILHTLAAARDRAALTAAEAAERTNVILDEMTRHHPVLGAANAQLVRELLGGTVALVSDDGVCSHCGEQLQSFDLTPEDRAVLVHDLVEKLVKPRLQGSSRYEPDAGVTADTIRQRWTEFGEFKAAAEKMSYDTVIDGANIGYYGLSSWYTEAKDALLRTRGVDPSSVPSVERLNVPFPVDVAPKFSLIEDMRATAERNGKKAVIVLHSRHLAHPTPENAMYASRWRALDALLPSPAFLNDDYCWLYAVLTRQDSCIISNDQMRDHYFTVLQPRFFLRWRQRHRITYKALYNKMSKAVTLRIHLPRAYSVWVQACGAASQRHWHVPFISNIDVIHQATNQTVTTSADVDLGKDGDDECTDWICTRCRSQTQDAWS
ncbi:hypothetical protein LSCM1_01269 [Leishmania martiniquensis]|uniref:PRORP domain-containing protein n=1 Tax=Leishmania martiniquensis TaxID=1580590 RepID=A0A836GNI2_9TRYP|nr:hypothetical protein LSCM1_01269 [Leishmania martiniquensis]